MSLVQTAGIEVVESIHEVSEPGNSTRYDVLGFRFNGRVYCTGSLGAVTDGWLVTLGNNGRSYLFHDKDHVPTWYIEEKLGVGRGDSPHIARAIARIIRGTTDAD